MSRLLLVHGAYHGAWCWDRLLPELDEQGVQAEAVQAVDLPFTSADDDRDEVAAAIERLGRSGEPVIVVGHSLGGAVISRAGGGASHLVYLTAVMTEAGLDLEFQATPGMSAMKSEGERSWVDPELATMAFYHRCAPADAEWATARLRPMPTATLMAPMPQRSAWRTVPSTYIVCTDDQIVSVATQRSMAAQAGAVVEMDADHSPFLSRPAELAAILAGVVARVDRDGR